MSEFLAWKKSNDRYFGVGDTSSEYFQRPWPSDSPMDLVETSYFGFSVPEAKVHAEIYHWAHPMCGLTSGGIFITQGIKSNSMDAAYANWMNYMPLPDDMTNCRYANGITVKMIRPLEEWQISFDDVAASTSLTLRITAIMPPAFRPIGGHFTQAVRTRGELVLRGTSYRIDGLSTRDRSWGDPRSERIVDVPPVGWRVMAFSDDLAFHDLAFESPELNPALAARYPGFENGRNLLWGYVWKDGQLRGLKQSRAHTELGVRGVGATSISLELVDETDEVHELTGIVEAGIPWTIWPNLTAFYSLTKWTYRGLVGYGDMQQGVNNQFISENLRD